ncbi:MAG: hypothetical protein NVS9B3_16380 [Gemmatimonadaceae bacterium]
MASPKVFLLSPARCDGERAKLLAAPAATFPLARQLRAEGVEIGTLFSFLSALYFRGKLTYARAFARGTRRIPPTLVITTDRGLVAPETVVGSGDVERFSRVDIATADDRYVAPLRRDAEALAAALSVSATVVLLGSIATSKYTTTLLDVFGRRLLFPTDFVGRGDMSRGGLLLRHAREGRELEYTPVEGAIRRGQRPPRLEAVR